MKKRIIGIIISALITLLFIKAAVNILDFDALSKMKNVNAEYCILAVLFYILTYPLRAFRIHYISKPEKGFAATLLVCFRHQFFGRIIPFKVGDLSLPFLLKKYCGSKIEQGSGTLLAVRFFDATVMLLSFLLCTVLAIGKSAASVLYVGGAAFIIIAVSPFFAGRIISGLKRNFPKNRIIGFAENIRISLSRLSSKDFFALLTATVALWIFIYLSMHFVAIAFGIEITFIRTVSASFLASAAALLPINGLGGFGVTETGWAAGFIMMGAERSVALASGIASNLMSFTVVCVFGAVSLILEARKNV